MNGIKEIASPRYAGGIVKHLKTLEKLNMTSNEPRQFVRMKTVIADLDFDHRSQVYSLIEQGRFPKPIKLGERVIAFDRAEFERWKADPGAWKEHEQAK